MIPDRSPPVVRPYSPVNQPGTNALVLAIKRYDDGTCSTWMDERSVGDTVPVMPLSGNLQLRDLNRDIVFLSTGTGITPLLSMARQYLTEGSGHITFVHGEKRPETLLYRETLDLLAAEHDRLSVHYVLSDVEWPGRTGFVQSHLDTYGADWENAHVYVCGVPQMVVDTLDTLADYGLPDERVFSEGWESGSVS